MGHGAQLALDGVTLLRRITSINDSRLILALDLQENLRKADEFADNILKQFDERVAKMGQPVQRQGVMSVLGLYFLGLEWLRKPTSELLLGEGEDAEHIASVIASKAKSESKEAEAPV